MSIKLNCSETSFNIVLKLVLMDLLLIFIFVEVQHCILKLKFYIFILKRSLYLNYLSKSINFIQRKKLFNDHLLRKKW